MRQDPMHVETDVLIIGSGGAGMYAAIEAARTGCDAFLIDRSLIGRGGATVMAQMTVAVALGAETPDHWSHHYDDTLEAGRGLCDERLARLLCEEGPECILQMDQWGVGWARKDGRIVQAFAPGHDRARCVYVDFLNTGPAVSKTLRTVIARATGIRKAGDLLVVEFVRAGDEVAGAVALHLPTGARGHHCGEGDGRRNRRAHPALPPQQRLRQYGRRRLCAGAAGGRAAGRHGVRAVLSDRAPLAAPYRHGPDHVGSVPLQARRAPAQPRRRRIHGALRRERGRPLRRHPRPRHLRHRQGGGGGARLAARRRLFELPALLGSGAAASVRTGDRPPRQEQYRPDPDADRGGADRALPHGRRGGRCAHGDRSAGSLLWPAKPSAAPMAPTGCRETPSPRRWCSAAAPGAAPPPAPGASAGTRSAHRQRARRSHSRAQTESRARSTPPR